jgi:pimeloyl-ACP methyl ester carboxylesterase
MMATWLSADVRDGQATSGVRFDRYGSGPPLVLIHPVGGDRRFWEAIVDRLAESRDLILPDLPGHGQSAPLTADQTPTPSRLAGSVTQLLDDLQIDRAHAGGSSLGAWVALELAVLGRALSVTAMCPSGLGPDVPPPEPPKRWLVPFMPLALRSNRFRKARLSHVLAHPERAPLGGLTHYSQSMALAPGYRATVHEMTARRFTDWDQVEVPVTLAWGEHDHQVCPISPPQPNVAADTLADCGHVPVWDNPEEVVRVLLETSARTTN